MTTVTFGMDESPKLGPSILVVEDDERIAINIVRALRSQSYEVAHVSTGVKARAAAREGHPDLVLLDLGLPDMDGLDVCRAIIDEQPDQRILLLTARADEIDVVLGLDAGAVDYVTKPFSLAELFARVRVQLRTTPQEPSPPEQQLQVGQVRLDEPARRVWVDDQEVALRSKEFDLLAALMRAAGRVVKREELMSTVWDEHWFGSTKTLDVHIASLRRKIGDLQPGPETAATPAGPEYTGLITTLRGVGYRFERRD